MRHINSAISMLLPDHVGRALLICFGAAQIPLISFGTAETLRGNVDWPMLSLLLLASIIGAIVAAVGLSGLLQPIMVGKEAANPVVTHKKAPSRQADNDDKLADLLHGGASAWAGLPSIGDAVDAAGRDTLTGFIDWPGFFQAMQPVLGHGAVGTLVILDCDRFENIDDRFGNGITNRILRAIASHILEHARTVDIAARWGTSSFVIYFDHLDEMATRQIVRQIEASLHDYSDPLHEELTVAISYGASVLLGHDAEDLWDAFEEADRHLLVNQQKKRPV